MDNPVYLSRLLLSMMEMRMFVYYPHRIPQDAAVVVISNHRSFMDPLVLMKACDTSIRTACHHYMDHVPLMRDVVHWLGAFPLESPEKRHQAFFSQATNLLKSRQWVGLFPEGAQPMVKRTPPCEIHEFHRGFAHLALRADVSNLAVLPIAIASNEESITETVPLRLLRLFDPSEPLFDQGGWHPMVTYQRANVLIGRPFWITPQHRQQYQGKQAKAMVNELTDYCWHEISTLLHQGCEDSNTQPKEISLSKRE